MGDARIYLLDAAAAAAGKAPLHFPVTFSPPEICRSHGSRISAATAPPRTDQCPSHNEYARKSPPDFASISGSRSFTGTPSFCPQLSSQRAQRVRPRFVHSLKIESMRNQENRHFRSLHIRCRLDIVERLLEARDIHAVVIVIARIRFQPAPVESRIDERSHVIGRHVGPHNRFDVIPGALAGAGIEMAVVENGKIVRVIGAVLAGPPVRLPVRKVHVVKIIVRHHAHQHQIVIELRSHRLVQQRVLQRTEISAGAEIQVFVARVLLENIGQPLVSRLADALNHRIAQDNRRAAPRNASSAPRRARRSCWCRTRRCSTRICE